MALKDWKKQKGRLVWKKGKKSLFVDNLGDFTEYGVGFAKDVFDYGEYIKIFKKEKSAINYAKAYMRKH